MPNHCDITPNPESEWHPLEVLGMTHDDLCPCHFMLMATTTTTPRVASFKHRDTRRYLHLTDRGYAVRRMNGSWYRTDIAAEIAEVLS